MSQEMPDLTIEYCYTCPSNLHWHKEVAGSKGKKYIVTYDWHHGYECSCPAFQFNKSKDCKHITKVSKDRCGWNWEAVCGDKGVPKEGPTGKLCPLCNEEVSIVRVGV